MKKQETKIVTLAVVAGKNSEVPNLSDVIRDSMRRQRLFKPVDDLDRAAIERIKQKAGA